MAQTDARKLRTLAKASTSALVFAESAKRAALSGAEVFRLEVLNDALILKNDLLELVEAFDHCSVCGRHRIDTSSIGRKLLDIGGKPTCHDCALRDRMVVDPQAAFEDRHTYTEGE